MVSFQIAWFMAAIALILLAGWLGSRIANSPFAILIDERGRYSLSHLQAVIWTILIGSTLLGTLASRYSMGFLDATSATAEMDRLGDQVVKLTTQIAEVQREISQALSESKEVAALRERQREMVAQRDASKARLSQLQVNPFGIPGTLLALLGIVATSVTSASTVKNNKNLHRPAMIRGEKSRGYAGALQADVTARPLQIVTEEEGSLDHESISVPKFQNLIFTLAIVIAYIVVTFQTGDYPVFDQAIVTLIGISHAGYVVGKIPDKA